MLKHFVTQLSVVSTYVHSEAQTPLVRFVVDTFYKHTHTHTHTHMTMGACGYRLHVDGHVTLVACNPSKRVTGFTVY